MNPKLVREIEGYWRVIVSVFLVMLYFLAGMVFVFSPFLTYSWAERTFPGFVVEQTLLVGLYHGQSWGARSSIPTMQVVTSLDGQPMTSVEDFDRFLNQAQPGQSITVGIMDQDFNYTSYRGIELAKFPKTDLLRLYWLPYVIGIIYLLLGVWVFWRRGNTISGQAFAFLSVSISLAVVLLFDVISTHIWVDLWSISVAQLGGGLTTLALFFPEPLPLLRRQRWLAALPLSITLLLSVWSVQANFYSADPWAYILAWRGSYIYAGAGILLFLGTLFYRLRYGSSPEVTQQARLILWGAFFAFTPVMIWAISPLFRLNIAWNPVIFLPLLIIFPVVIAVTIVRHRLWDLEIILNRTLVYSILTVLLGSIFISGVFLLELLLSNIIPLTTAISAALPGVLITLLFNPLRNRIQQFIDRRFFRQKYDIAQTITVFQNSVRDTIDLEVLETGLKSVIQETMHPEHVTMCTCSHGTEKPKFYIEEQDPLRGLLLASEGGVEVSRLKVDSPALERLRQEQVTLTIPLTSQGELIGVLNLGSRRSGQPYSSYDRQLLTMLAAQVAPALRMAHLVQQQNLQAREQERMRQEMQVASLIQRALLPKEVPNLEGWEIAVDYQPARAVSGDFYDFYARDGKLVLLVGDVTDKGMPAALVMATSRSILRGTARRRLTPGKALEQANEILVAEMLPYMFVTCFYSVLDLKSGHFVFANAGHCLPVHLSQNGAKELYATGFPLGLFENAHYEEVEAWLSPDDTVLLYSDGLIEAHNEEGEMFGVEQVLDILSKIGHDQMLDTLKTAMERHTGKPSDPEDDTTMLCLHRSKVTQVEPELRLDNALVFRQS